MKLPVQVRSPPRLMYFKHNAEQLCTCVYVLNSLFEGEHPSEDSFQSEREAFLAPHSEEANKKHMRQAFVAQLVERSHGKGKVSGSSPAVGIKKDDCMMRRLHVTLKAFEPPVLTKVSHTLHNLCVQLHSEKEPLSFFKRVGLPTLRKYLTVLRSPHVHKKSREQFVMHQYKIILRMNASLGALFQQRVMFACKHVTLSGVQMRHVTQYSSSLWASRV